MKRGAIIDLLNFRFTQEKEFNSLHLLHFDSERTKGKAAL